MPCFSLLIIPGCRFVEALNYIDSVTIDLADCPDATPEDTWCVIRHRNLVKTDSTKEELNCLALL